MEHIKPSKKLIFNPASRLHFNYFSNISRFKKFLIIMCLHYIVMLFQSQTIVGTFCAPDFFFRTRSLICEKFFYVKLVLPEKKLFGMVSLYSIKPTRWIVLSVSRL